MKKIDLHIHTIATEKDADFVFDIDKMQLYVEKSKLDAIAITNHNMFDIDQFNSIKEKLNISVFPGVEVDVENAHKTILRRSMKKQAIKILGGECMICGYNKCIDALELYHKDPNEKEFKLGSGNTMSWKEYRSEVKKCILLCSNCHKEIYASIGYFAKK